MHSQSCESSLNAVKNYWLLRCFLIKLPKRYQGDTFSCDNQDTGIQIMLTGCLESTWRKEKISQWFDCPRASHCPASGRLQGRCFIPRALHLSVTFKTNLLHYLNHSSLWGDQFVNTPPVGLHHKLCPSLSAWINQSIGWCDEDGFWILLFSVCRLIALWAT